MASIFQEGSRPSLDQVLARKEERVREIQALLEIEGVQAVLCYKLNIPGPIKNNGQIRRLFALGLEEIDQALVQDNPAFLEDRLRTLETGDEYLAAFAMDPKKVKEKTVAIENASPLARLFDIDVEGKDGAISRQEVGAEERRCFLCEKPAKVCARSRAHTVEEMQDFIDQLYRERLSEKASSGKKED